MKKYLIILLLAFACKKENIQTSQPPITTQPPPPIAWVSPKPANMVFYSKDSSYAHKKAMPIDVWIEGKYIGRIHYYYSWSTNPPRCGDNYSLNYSDTIFKARSYHAKQYRDYYSADTLLSWDGSVDFKEDTCIKVEFFTHD